MHVAFPTVNEQLLNLVTPWIIMFVYLIKRNINIFKVHGEPRLKPDKLET